MLEKNSQLFLPEFSYFYEVLELIENGYEGQIDLWLDGSRSSGKTTHIMLFLGILFYMKKSHIISMRETPKMSKETYNQFKEATITILNFHKNNFNGTDRYYKYKNSLIRFMGYKSNTKKKVAKLGIHRSLSPEVVVRFFDEITEFKEPSPIIFTNQAQGGAPIIINIRTFNPFSPYNFFVKEMIAFHPYNEDILKTIGSDLKVKWLAKDHLKIAHHSNHRINTFLSLATHKELISLHEIDPFKARTADLGLPGLERGSVYPIQILEKVGHPSYNLFVPTLEFRGGVDWGESSSVGGSAVAALFGRIGFNNSGVMIDNEYYHSNSKNIKFKTTDTLLREVAIFFHNQIQEWNKSQILKLGGVNIYVDNAATGIIKGLRDEFSKLKWGHIFNIQRCYKYKIAKRIRVVKYLMGQGRFFINQTTCPMLWSELNQSLYDETKLHIEEVRLKENDDCLDAMEYLINKNLIRLVDKGYNLLNKEF